MVTFPPAKQWVARKAIPISICLLVMIAGLGRVVFSFAGMVSALDSAPGIGAVRPVPGAVDVPNNASLDGTLQVTFTEPVTLLGPALELVCERSEVHTLVAAGSSAIYTFTSDRQFLPGEDCVATLRADFIIDKDTDDPPNSMLSDYTWTFHTAAEPVVINELNAISPDGKTDFIELYDGGQGNTDLTGLTLVFYRGDESLVYLALALNGYQTDERGYFVLGSINTPGYDILLATGTILDGPDAIALYSAPAYNFPNNTPVTTKNLVDAVVYGQADAKLMALMLPGQMPIDENARGAGSSDSSQRCPNGGGLPRTSDHFLQETPTADDPNRCLVDLSPSVLSVSPAAGQSNVPFDVAIEILFSEPVFLNSEVLEIVCTKSGKLDYTIQGSGATWQFVLDSPLKPGETCAATLFAEKVSDVDDQDPPDHLTQTITWSFFTIIPIADNMLINEIDTDTPGADAAEFIELYDGGQGNTSLDGLIIVLFNGEDDRSYHAIDLKGQTTDSNGYFVLGNTTVAGADLTFPNALLQNGPDAVALIAGQLSDFPNGTVATAALPIDAIVYGPASAIDPGLLPLLNPGQSQVDENGRGNVTNHSNQRCPNGGGGPRNTSGYKQNTPTPGKASDCLTDSAPTVSSKTPQPGAYGVSIDAEIIIEFSEPVAIQDNWTQVSCNKSGQHSYELSDGPTSFTLHLAMPLDYSENCTVSVLAAGVSDLDNDDPPDSMVATITWSFSTADKPADFVLINEIDPDTPSTDTAEFIELYDGGIGDTSLDGLVLVLFNGSTNQSYQAMDLDDLTTDPVGYFLIGNSTVNPGLTFPNSTLQNGPDAAAIYMADAADFPANSPIRLDGLVDAVVYGGGASTELLQLLVAGQPALNENAGGQAAQHSLQRCPNGSGGARHSASFLANLPTPGNANNCLSDEPPKVVSVTPTNFATGVSINTNLTITFSEAVVLGAGAVDISCAPGGDQDYTISGGPVSFQIDPLYPLPYFALCTAQVIATKITDSDVFDPPNFLQQDFEWSFTTIKPPTTSVRINEVDSDTPGTDKAEFIELFDGGTGHSSLSGLIIVFWNGQDDKSYRVIDLAGKQTNSGGYFLLGNPGVAGIDLSFPNGGLQNGPDAIGLYQSDVASFPTGTTLTTTGLVDAVVYGAADTPDPQLLTLLDPGQPQLDESGRGAITSHSLQRCPNGGGGPRQTTAYQPDTPTPGKANTCVLDAPPAVGQVSPINGSIVAINTHLSVSFNEDVTAEQGWYRIACELSGNHPALVSGGPSLYTLTPTTEFTFGEMCTVTLFAGAIHDADNDDPPDTMDKDYTWSFRAAESDPPPVAGFTSNSPVWLGQPVIFTNTTTGDGPLSYLWDFGDGSPSSMAVHPIHVYPEVGRYTVTLTATGKGTATAIGEVEVIAHQLYLPMLAR